MEDSIFDRLNAYRHETSVTPNNKSLKPSEKLLLQLKEYGFKLDEMSQVLKTQGNQLILSCAGSGKTTTLVFKIIYDVVTGYSTKLVEINDSPTRVMDRVLVCTFLKSGAEELKSSLIQWQRKLHCADVSSAIQFCTLHAEFKRALNALSITTEIISASKNTSLLKEAIKPYMLRNEKGRPLNSENVRDLEGALTYTRNRLDDKRYVNDVYADFSLTSQVVDCILRDWKALRKKAGLVDFEDLQEMLYEECYIKNNKEVADYLGKRYNFIYIDEFQDTSQIQYALLKLYGVSAKQVVAIGDDDQTIYSWRGSYNGIITHHFMEDFNPIKNDLSVNFRCPENILNAIKPSISLNKNRFQKNLSSFRKGGSIRVLECNGYMSMLSELNKSVLEDCKNGKSVAILCRVNSDGLAPAMFLDKEGSVSFSISGEGMTLNSYIGGMVLNIVKLFTDSYTQAVKNALGLLTWDKNCIDNLVRVCRNNKKNIWTIDEKDLSYSCPSIVGTLKSWRNLRETNGDIVALEWVLEYYRVSVFDTDSQFNCVARAVISTIKVILMSYKYADVNEFLDDIENINERLLARRGKMGTKVRIATVHEFKGKEADSVYVFNDSENVFPYSSNKDKNKAIDVLTEEFEEERRVHYIACTRAKERLTILYQKSLKGTFLKEMDLANAKMGTCSDEQVLSYPLKRDLTQERNLEKFENECKED